MIDQILDDVKELLEKEYGDKRVLEQIQRAAENNEVISNYERSYVEKLVEQYLERQLPVEDIPETPDVELPSEIHEEKSAQPVETIQYQPEPIITKSSSKNTKLFVGIGIAILAIIIVGAVSLSGISNISNDIDTAPTETISDETSDSIISVKSDLESYTNGDIISINGKSDPSFGDKIKLSIQNNAGNTVWTEELDIKNDGRYSTLTFAGGFGWDSGGIFTLTVEHGDESKSKTFSFKG